MVVLRTTRQKNKFGTQFNITVQPSLSISDDFRVFCGDLGNEVTDEILTRNFAKYPSFLKAKVVRDKKSNKSKGYGFLSFKDPSDFVKAMREMNGKCLDCNDRKYRFCFINCSLGKRER